MFAPRTGAPLAVGAALLLLWGSLTAVGLLPHAAAVDLLIAAAGAIWAFLLWFFRDPTRPVGAEIVSGADGRVLAVEANAEHLWIRVFMGVTDVHVNRFPLSAKVITVSDGGRGFAPAYAPSAEGNVQRGYRLETMIGEVEVRQFTGIVARRLVSFVQAGEVHAKGDRLGMIVLGSRLDVRLPADRVVALVNVGDVVRAGVTPIAREKT
ncbi:MAG TPA: phosphatidylserine decarboxylase [Thermoplasmata archaeon]|nr:phosphatidylserine decarboxylase [Thermoplasmata archaeon]